MDHRWEPGELGGQLADEMLKSWRTMYDEPNAQGLARMTEWFRGWFLPEFTAGVEEALKDRFREPPSA